ncbi:dTDP-4-dehydrorhamnose reductase family protein [Bacillus fonticola]|uniref:dTDP-4-dehydrorhamnose reductase family protein n=1 Tax=Bacillus fonticola TaxID=2728853 RepID=UPI001473C0A7|nr:SDR family oxidoreductase [Bacillus fonticola]
MKILVFGGGGMLGHMVVSYLRTKGYDVSYTVRGDDNGKGGIPFEATNFAAIKPLIQATNPDVVINAIGLLNHHAKQHVAKSILVNAYFPHKLSEVLMETGGRLIHISTDCVFSGEKGAYTTDDPHDAVTVYGKTKSLGEITNSPHLTIRTSIIGPDQKENGIGLLKWFLSQNGEIRGYKNAMWNGVTTLQLAKAIEVAIREETKGLLQFTAPSSISKYDLLCHMKRVFQHDVTIIPEERPIIDRTLKVERTDFPYEAPTYDIMLEELRDWMNGHDD